MPTVPPTPVPEVPPTGWTIDKRQAIGAALGLLCLGILIGFKMGSSPETVVERPVFVEKKAPCADCAERDLKAQREAHHAVPGDSSLPEED